jgi:regulator of cell morphogenesis and NO signaling
MAITNTPRHVGQEFAIMSATITQNDTFAGRTLAEIAATLPGATSVFRRRKLDFCCGGKVSLADAAAEKGLPLAELEDELTKVALQSQPTTLPDATGDLIDLIVNRYHAVHRREFPELIKLARRVEAVHQAHPAAPHGLADLLHQMEIELGDHMNKEEQVLFPLMRQGGHPAISQPIAMMLADHDDHGVHLRAVEELTDDFTVPDDACPTWRALYVGTRKLSDDLMQHIHTENHVLFPRFTA